MLGKLQEGMRVRIRIREGTPAPIKDEFIECIIEKIGETSLTVTPISFYVRKTDGKSFTLPYADIVGIEYRAANDLDAFVGGVAAGAMLIIVLTLYGFSQLN